jgi:RNA polymerase sigma-70 factor (ECF subfamily)
MGLGFDYLQYATKGLEKERVLTDLMTAYGKDVWKYAYFLTLRAEAADDIMQDVFLRAYQKMHLFRGTSSAKTWLFSIARNAARDYKKSYWVRNIILFGDRHPETAITSAEQEAIRAFERKETWRLVLALPAKLREVLLLHSHYGMTVREIAELLGVSEGTVKSRMHRARTKVNESWKEEER